jgi:hypothetical protein
MVQHGQYKDHKMCMKRHSTVSPVLAAASVGEADGMTTESNFAQHAPLAAAAKTAWVNGHLCQMTYGVALLLNKLWCSTYLQVCLHHVPRLRLCVQHQVYRVALRHQQVPAVPERVEHNY